MMWGITVILAIVMMIGYFLILWGAVGFIQNKKLFSSAHEKIKERIEDHEERFTGQHLLGYKLVILGILMLVLPVFYGLYDGIKNNIGYIMISVRILVMLVALEIYDILFFDWFLLCHSNFFPHYYPEIKDIVGPQLFGYNMKNHIIHIIAYIIFSFLISLITFFFN